MPSPYNPDRLAALHGALAWQLSLSTPQGAQLFDTPPDAPQSAARAMIERIRAVGILSVDLDSVAVRSALDQLGVKRTPESLYRWLSAPSQSALTL